MNLANQTFHQATGSATPSLPSAPDYGGARGGNTTVQSGRYQKWCIVSVRRRKNDPLRAFSGWRRRIPTTASHMLALVVQATGRASKMASF